MLFRTFLIALSTSFSCAAPLAEAVSNVALAEERDEFVSSGAFAVKRDDSTIVEKDATGPFGGQIHSEFFGLVAIRSGSSVQYQAVVIDDGALFLAASGLNYDYFNGTVLDDGSLLISPDSAPREAGTSSSQLPPLPVLSASVPTGSLSGFASSVSSESSPDPTDGGGSNFQPLFLSVDEYSSSYVVSSKRDPSFAIKGGHLTYKLKDGAYAVPYSGSFDFTYTLKFWSDDNSAIGIALRTVTGTGGTPADFPLSD